jgi:chondroitin sulfate synthase
VFAVSQVIIFSSENSSLPSRPDIRLVALRGIDDSYPPQRKSFAMLKYMYDHYIDQFSYFMRADDDVYIRGDVLGRFLHSINSTRRALMIGQVGRVVLCVESCSNPAFRIGADIRIAPARSSY